MPPAEQEVRFRCPHCGTLGGYTGEYRVEILLRCAECAHDVTREFRKAVFRGVAADINARQVARDNEPFLRYLTTGWPENPDPPDRNG